MTKQTATEAAPLTRAFVARLLERGDFAVFAVDQDGEIVAREGGLFPELEVGRLASETLYFLDGMEGVVEALKEGHLEEFKLPNVRMMTSDSQGRDFSFELIGASTDQAFEFLVYAWDVSEAATAEQATIHKHNTTSLANERLALEKDQAEDLARSQSHFLSTISNELRTPLTLALGNCDLLRDQTVYLDENARNACLTDIRDNASDLLGFVSDLLDYTKAESDGLLITDETVDLVAEAERQLQAFHRQAVEQGLSLKGDLPSNSIKMRGERRRIRQILTSLLTNALKFTPKGGTVKLGLEASDKMISLSLSDTGVGMSEDEISMIGQPFLKFEKNPFDNHLSSNGLGLALTKKLVEAHDGHLSFESEVGNGTTVTVSFPKGRRL